MGDSNKGLIWSQHYSRKDRTGERHWVKDPPGRLWSSLEKCFYCSWRGNIRRLDYKISLGWSIWSDHFWIKNSHFWQCYLVPPRNKQQVPFDYCLCARHWPKHFPWITSFNLHNNPKEWCLRLGSLGEEFKGSWFIKYIVLGQTGIGGGKQEGRDSEDM